MPSDCQIQECLHHELPLMPVSQKKNDKDKDSKDRKEILREKMEGLGEVLLSVPNNQEVLITVSHVLHDFMAISLNDSHDANNCAPVSTGTIDMQSAFKHLRKLRTPSKINQFIAQKKSNNEQVSHASSPSAALHGLNHCQLFCCLDQDHQIQVMQGLLNTSIHHILHQLELSDLRALPIPKGYTPREWNIIVNNQLKEREATANQSTS